MPTPDVLLYDYPGSICCQMVRLTLAEKGVPYRRQTVDIMVKAEQFEPWYTALNPKAVVPTLKIGEEIVIDTMIIVPRIDADFDGPPLTPSAPAERAAMQETMRDVMALHYGVLLYAPMIQTDGTSPTIVARGEFLRAERARHPERAEALDRRIAGNERLQKLLADPVEVARHIGEAKALVGRLDAALAKHPFVSAESYSLADAYTAAALARFRLHGFQHWWTDGGNPNVAAYYARIEARPSWAEAGVINSGSERDL